MFPARDIKCCCLQTIDMFNKSGFYEGLSGCYMAFTNYIAALTFTLASGFKAVA